MKHLCAIREQLKSRRFNRLFLKNTLIIFSGVLCILLIAELTVYFYSSRLLIREVDAANIRGAQNAQATVERVCEETELAVSRVLLSDDLGALARMGYTPHSSFDFYERVAKVQENLYLSRRLNLDHSFVLYFTSSDYVLSSIDGGQPRQYYNNQGLLEAYRDGRYCIQKIPTSLYSNRFHWTITYYKGFIGTEKGRGFMAVNVQTDLLAKYLSLSVDGSDSNIVVLDRDGSILMDTEMLLTGGTLNGLLAEPEDRAAFESAPIQGALTLWYDGQLQRLSWVSGGRNGWTYMQLTPFDAYMEAMAQLRRFLLLITLAGLAFSVAVAFIISARVFRPMADIIRVTENPDAQDQLDDSSGEIQYLLMNILESFQKNSSLEQEMVQKVAALRSTRARALQEQITPHFLYNALQAINWLACEETGDMDSSTCRAIVTLSDLVRTGAEEADNQATVGKELEYIEKFMEIEKIRFGDGISLHISVPESLLDEPFLRLSLQPLVENAISHGLRPKGAIGNIYLTMEARPAGIYTVVEDDGVGMGDGEIAAFDQSLGEEYIFANRHIGMINLAQRIRLVYGEGYRIYLSHSSHGGLKVEFTIPYVKNTGLNP